MFYTFCIDLYHALVSPGDTYSVVPETTPRFPGLANNIGRIGFLYNQYGSFLMSSSVYGSALNLALWELVYDVSPSLTSGNFRATANSTIISWANYYLNQSAGKYEAVTFLNVNDPSVNTTDPMEMSRSQGILAQGSFNFANVPAPAPLAPMGAARLFSATDESTETSTSTVPGTTTITTSTVVNPVVEASVVVQIDTLDPKKTSLIVTGTSGDDTIDILSTSKKSQV